MHADCVEGFRATAKLLEFLRHAVEEATPPVEAERCAIAFVTVRAAELRTEIEDISRLAQVRPQARDFETATDRPGLLRRSIRAAQCARAARMLLLTAREGAPFFEGYDVLLTSPGWVRRQR